MVYWQKNMYSPYDKEKYPTRKKVRLQGYDYSKENYYFVTICTHQRKCIFGDTDELNCFGQIARNAVEKIPIHYPEVHVEKYVIMPNHIHAILYLHGGKSRLDTIIGSYKSYVSKAIHEIKPDLKVWQDSFHDHIIRSRKAYEKIWLYIDGNPMNWERDCFYSK